MQDLLTRLGIPNATEAHLKAVLEKIGRTIGDFPIGEDLDPLAYQVAQMAKGNNIVQSPRKGFGPVATRVATKAIGTTPTSIAEEKAPIEPYTPIDLSEPIDWASMTPQQVSIKTAGLEAEVNRLQLIKQGKQLQKRMLELQGNIAAEDAESVDLDRQLLEATENLHRQQLQNQLRRAASRELMALQAETVTAAVNDDVQRTKAALGKYQEVAAGTPNPAEISTFRAQLLQSQRWNEAAGIQNSTQPLAIVGAVESQIQTIEA